MPGKSFDRNKATAKRASRWTELLTLLLFQLQAREHFRVQGFELHAPGGVESRVARNVLRVLVGAEVVVAEAGDPAARQDAP